MPEFGLSCWIHSSEFAQYYLVEIGDRLILLKVSAVGPDADGLLSSSTAEDRVVDFVLISGWGEPCLFPISGNSTF